VNHLQGRQISQTNGMHKGGVNSFPTSDEQGDKLFWIPRAGWPALLQMGMGVRGGLPKKGEYTRLEAWIWLGTEYWTKQIIPGLGVNHTSLVYAGGPVTYPHAAWGWTPKDVRAFALELRECELIDDELCEIIIKVSRDPYRVGGRPRHVPTKTRAAVLAKTDGKCVYCGVKLTTKAGHPHSYHPDHVLPVIKGGGNDVANLIPSCATCNTRKGAKTFLIFTGGGE
jgi:hypothetical protein